MDTFVEQIVRKKKEPLDYLIIVAVVLLALVLSVAILKYLLMIMPLIVLIIWGAWWLITNRNKEFEYSITNGEMDIDCIVARRRRKRLLSVTCAKVESFGKWEPEKFAHRKFENTIMAAPAVRDAGNFYFTYHSKKNGSTLVIFQPDERVQKAFLAALPRLMQIEFERTYGQV